MCGAGIALAAPSDYGAKDIQASRSKSQPMRTANPMAGYTAKTGGSMTAREWNDRHPIGTRVRALRFHDLRHERARCFERGYSVQEVALKC